MKKYVSLICVILLSILIVGFKSTTVNTFPLFGKLIVLDSGHGGADPGSIYENEYEKNYNLKFTKVLKSELENLGATVLVTRDGDYDLSAPDANKRKRSDFNNRIKLINESNADLYISLHMNYLSNSKYYGSQVFYSDTNEHNKTIAESIQKELNLFFNYDKDYKKIGNDKYMYKNINVKGVLIEYGFISSQKDRDNLKSEKYQKELSQVIIKGILNYFT